MRHGAGEEGLDLLFLLRLHKHHQQFTRTSRERGRPAERVPGGDGRHGPAHREFLARPLDEGLVPRQRDGRDLVRGRGRLAQRAEGLREIQRQLGHSQPPQIGRRGCYLARPATE